MKSQYKTKGVGWTTEEEEDLLTRINKNLYSSGNVCWMGVKKIKGRTLSSMQSHWKVMRKIHIYDGQRWLKNDEEIKEAPRMKEARTVKEQVKEFLETYPNADNNTAAQFIGCTSQYVSRLRKENNLPRSNPYKPKETIQKTPEVKRQETLKKRVKVKKSFLWGAYTFERYE